MVIPESFVVLLLGGAFVVSALSHYRALKSPDSPALTLPFWIGLAALLLVFLFLMSGAAWPDWEERKLVFLGVALVFFLGAFARLLHGKTKAAG